MTPPKQPSTATRTRPPSPYKPANPVDSWEALHTVLNKYGAAWEQWGQDVLGELDALEQSSSHGGGTGKPPTDATQPPKPPFK